MKKMLSQQPQNHHSKVTNPSPASKNQSNHSFHNSSQKGLVGLYSFFLPAPATKTIIKAISLPYPRRGRSNLLLEVCHEDTTKHFSRSESDRKKSTERRRKMSKKKIKFIWATDGSRGGNWHHKPDCSCCVCKGIQNKKQRR